MLCTCLEDGEVPYADDAGEEQPGEEQLDGGVAADAESLGSHVEPAEASLEDDVYVLVAAVI